MIIGVIMDLKISQEVPSATCTCPLHVKHPRKIDSNMDDDLSQNITQLRAYLLVII